MDSVVFARGTALRVRPPPPRGIQSCRAISVDTRGLVAVGEKHNLQWDIGEGRSAVALGGALCNCGGLVPLLPSLLPPPSSAPPS